MFYTENAIKCITKIFEKFDDIIISECIDNYFLLKIKKNNNGSIGYLFGLIEDLKTSCSLAEYSIRQTTLEQIFNTFANEKEDKLLYNNDGKENKISKEFLDL